MAHTVAYDQLRVSIFDTVAALAASAADDLAAILRHAIAEQGSTRVHAAASWRARRRRSRVRRMRARSRSIPRWRSPT